LVSDADSGHHNRLLPAAHHHALDRILGIRIDFLVRDVRRNENEVAGSGFLHKFQALAPAESRAPFHYIKNRFEIAVMMRAGLGVRLHHYCSGPKFVRARAGVIDSCGARHAGSLRGIRIQLARAHYADAVLFPIRHTAARRRLFKSSEMARHSSASS
jgi:hypothetical protein